ncbi:hypothetical protein EXIGLDRAFT_736854 [Exidia glandulosa HHB12029]|uniref:SAGA-associated factor 11 n=1 Tax=Exidia glandulosa HHB12029 TaxID=1314781 RepID=A0A165PGJ6_EXIGL|nr:hypothetical protein EXIGLDRAFT_736854 [Exidia glandulosa HHB12029]
MSFSKRDEVLNGFTSRLFDAMLSDIVMDVALQSHSEIARSRELCERCNTRCGTVHIPPSAARANGTGSRAHTPLPSPSKAAGSAVASGAGTPNGKDAKGDSSGNVMLECMNCKRSVASNRFAQHLSGCLGLAGGARRTNARTATSKVKALSPDRNSSPSPKKMKKAQQPKLPPGSMNGHGTNGLHSAASSHVKSKVNSKLQQATPPPMLHAYSQSRTTDSSPDSGSSDSPPPSPKPVVKKPPPPAPSKTVSSQQQQQQWTLPSSNALQVPRRQSQPKPADLTGDYSSDSSSLSAD